ncbi:MAG: SDR family NAD(P)-dependent oxidoreductase [Alphaproteobacteria bacterium]|nr:SDR family NAD(P)-dependent oxidoreductase [Alphaproteobacteria bacterium]
MIKPASQQRLAGRVALVTGASRGIGAAVAKGFAMEGAHVIMLARTQGALEALDDEIQAAGGKATLLPFDLAETKKIGGIAPVIAERFRRLDILVGNAAMLGNLSPVAMSDHKVFEETFKVNFFANYHLIRALDPYLRGSDAGRAIFVTSGAAHMSSPFWSGYAASKAALENMVATYAAETAYSPLKVNILDPGAVRTEMRAEAFPGEDANKLPAPETLVERFIELAAPSCAATGKLVQAAA